METETYTPEEIQLLKRYEEETHGIQIKKINSDLNYEADDPFHTMSVGRVGHYKGKINPQLAKMIIENSKLGSREVQLSDAEKKYVAGLIEEFEKFAGVYGIDVKNSSILYTQNPDILPITLTLARDRVEEEARRLRFAYRKITGIITDDEIGSTKIGYMKFTKSKEGSIEDIMVEPYKIHSDSSKIKEFSANEIEIAKDLTGIGFSPNLQDLKRISVKRTREEEVNDTIRRKMLNVIRDAGIAHDEQTLERILAANTHEKLLKIISEYGIIKSIPNAHLEINYDSETGKITSLKKTE